MTAYLKRCKEVESANKKAQTKYKSDLKKFETLSKKVAGK